MTHCVNCARLTSEPSRARLPLDTSSPTAFYRYAAKRNLNLTIPYGTFGVPIPASVHYSDEGMKEYPWKDWETKREILVTGWFAINVQNIKARRIRFDLHKHCTQRLDKCALIEIFERGGHQAKTVSLTSARDSKVVSSAARENLTATFQNGYDYYRNSIFCLQPPGDMEMRKGVFDSILLGCIPVLLLPRILSKKYPWYFSQEVEKLVSVNVQVHNVDNVVTYLESIPDDVVREKRRAMAELAPSLIYSLPPIETSDVLDKGKKETTWQPPFRDAVDVMLQALFQRVRNYNATREIPVNEKLLNAYDGELYWKYQVRKNKIKTWKQKAKEGESTP
eukprot:CAMPEP_0114425248 /NCGR_PEP_ID=MMETSP0103-20121206/7133_1 /TAXON_ID=37642 ORGANISM="Paraphysomonas imperforata, Strain PA2" /NCGR_SAMPLE_ID=MMETSP0103 /ASSEMBLY_ACC=CAM_ASM_000201 /LENGTH=335 /DNA_ID=CAMNT_0001594069 /DNA_START=517 /DNA_END=1523 /DNA_ORIENTATION=-